MNQQLKSIDEILKGEGFTIISQVDEVKDERPLGEAERELIDHLKYMVNNEKTAGMVVTEKGEKIPHRETGLTPRTGRAEDRYDIGTIVEYLNWHMNRISENVIGRDEIIRQAFFQSSPGSICFS